MALIINFYIEVLILHNRNQEYSFTLFFVLWICIKVFYFSKQYFVIIIRLLSYLIVFYFLSQIYLSFSYNLEKHSLQKKEYKYELYSSFVCPFQGEMSLATKGLKSLSASPYPPLKRGNIVLLSNFQTFTQILTQSR